MKTKKLLSLIPVILGYSITANAASDVIDAKVVNVYQHDSDATVFEMRTSVNNTCGGVYERVKETSKLIIR
jgi:hypothetical protein